MASNVPDLRSANQTFTDTFSRKPLGLDYAYIQHNFNDSFKAVGGKFRFPAYLYTSSDHLWDGDINPEGFSVNYSHKSDLGTTFINGGNWTLAENGNNGKDPYMLYGQAGQTFKHGNVFGTVAGTYYSFKEVLSRNAFTNAGSNTDYHFGGIYAVAGEIGLTDMLETGIKTSIIADWTHNSDTTSAEDTSHLLGVKFAEGPWTLRHAYSDIERNAWPDIFPDSERFDGLTGTKGYEIVFEYELMTNVLLALDYYSMERSVINTDQDLFHIDLNVRF